VHSPEFEAAVVKVLADKEELLAAGKRRALEPFLRVDHVPTRATAVPASDEEGFAEHILKRRRVSSFPSNSARWFAMCWIDMFSWVPMRVNRCVSAAT
jgi:hypothetical protein